MITGPSSAVQMGQPSIVWCLLVKFTLAVVRVRWSVEHLGIPVTIRKCLSNTLKETLDVIVPNASVRGKTFQLTYSLALYSQLSWKSLGHVIALLISGHMVFAQRERMGGTILFTPSFLGRDSRTMADGISPHQHAGSWVMITIHSSLGQFSSPSTV